MLRDPCVTPGVVVSPLIWVHVDGAVVDGLDGEVFLEVNAFVARVRVGLFIVGDVGGC